MLRHTHSAKGFTLIELVIVIAILAIISAVAIPAYMNIASTARDNASRAALGAIRESLSISYANSATGGGTPTYPVLVGTLFTTGVVPAEPYTPSSAVTTTAENPIATFSGAGGYVYNQTTGEVRINSSNVPARSF